ncbi:MAG: hypothetical protein HW382_1004, partial [Deltaproteobacteria bacterium]|nr:hypothetical protein [Deltaproteobacteria bacterium]
EGIISQDQVKAACFNGRDEICTVINQRHIADHTFGGKHCLDKLSIIWIIFKMEYP